MDFPKPDPNAVRVINYCDEFLRDNGLQMASRHMVYKNESSNATHYHCILKAYKRLGQEDETKLVYEIQYTVKETGTAYFNVEGPYEDAGDQYWDDLLEHDQAAGNGLITPDYMHYTVCKDSRNPGQGDGFGGQEFTVNLGRTGKTEQVERYRAMGLRLEECDDGTILLKTRNLWQQGRIPKKHRDKFPPNCKVL